jgi:hypothetical protein
VEVSEYSMANTKNTKSAKVMYSTLGDDKIHMKYIGNHRRQYDDIKLLLNDGSIESITLYKDKRRTNYMLIFDEDGIHQKLVVNPTMLKLGIRILGTVVIVKTNDDGDNVDIDIDLKQLKQMITHTVEFLYPYLHPNKPAHSPSFKVVSFR